MRKILFLISFLFVTFLSSNAQDLLKGKDLSQLKVDMISQSDLAKLRTQLSSAGLTLDQAEQMAISKGMPASEAAKLKQKLSGQAGSDSKTVEKNNSVRENSEQEVLNENKNLKSTPIVNPLIFGSELYTAAALSFEPNLKMATPLNYILGPEDQIQVSVYGIQEYNGSLTISPEGNVSIQNVGEVKLAGLTIEAATQKLKNVMGNSIYTYLKSGGAKISVTLSKIRTISITIIGSNRPGNYKVSSLSSVFNALYIAGGPTNLGSFREIELIRNNKLERKIDLYHFLLEGSQSDNVSLKDNDVIRIPTYKTRIEIKGEVKRPGIFEVLPGESLSSIFSYASGFTDDAYTSSVKIFQRNDKERQIQDLTSLEYNKYKPQSGDVVEVSKILERFKNRVTIKGAIFRPSAYELLPNMKVADLIRKADGLKADAFIDRAQILRTKEDQSKIVLSFNVSKAIDGNALDNISLEREDEVLISSKADLINKFKLTIQGEVKMPGEYNYAENMTLKDLILMAGGFTDAAFKNIEIARSIKRDTLSSLDNSSVEIIKTTIEGNSLSTNDNDKIILKPFDVIIVRRIAGYLLPESVLINGQIQFPGPYSISNRSERITDLLKRAGGFLPEAFPEGAYLKRYKTNIELENSIESGDKFKKTTNDSSKIVGEEISRPFDKIPLDLNKALKNPGSIDDILLKVRDEIYIPKFEGQIRVSGEVLVATQVPYQTNSSVSYYVDAAGGFTSNALKRKTFVIYANGKAASTKSFLFFKSYPKIQPGSELVIPKKREKKATSIAEIVGITSALASLITVFVLLKQ